MRRPRKAIAVERGGMSGHGANSGLMRGNKQSLWKARTAVPAAAPSVFDPGLQQIASECLYGVRGMKFGLQTLDRYW
ncbi:hypothetical protein BSZ19_15480 [Bradyrhizobium japonicum]|uniref:Uncharacterized protein n=1 Tax=Bradyrhizobium japonicum TaxID=375 RepID=A0A1Y2JQ84_BRAJP|nr:hypothetical protein BSZ19_15480 [Bradyrhizobium japonicum]